MNQKTALAAALVASITGAPLALAQDKSTTTATTPAQLVEALRAAGYDLSEITSVNEDGTVSISLPADVAAELADSQATEETPAEPAPPSEPEPEWDSKLTLTFGYADGNTENFNFGALFGTVREDDVGKLTIDGYYFYNQDSGNKSENRGSLGVVYDWYFDERWFAFADGRYDYDEFKSWRHRVSGHVGVGYHLIDEDDFKLTPRVGVGASKEFLSDRNEIIPEGLAGLDLEWQITPNQSLVASTYYYPYLDDLGEFRWVNTAGWNIKIDKADGLSLTLGFLHEHESDPDEGIEPNDFKLFGGLTFEF